MAEKTDAVVATAKLTKIFRDFWCRERVTAVSDLDLEIHPGEVFGLLGPNGSGKSTTLKLILGLLFPTRGRVAVFGKPPTDVAIKARIGFLPEDSYLYPFLSAQETLDFYGRLFHQPRKERLRRIDRLLEMVGLASVRYRRIGEYSKGMQRRIGLAQALINDPDLLIVDEPTSGLDPIGRKQFKDLIALLPNRGKTVILSSHLLADVEDVCDRVCILYGGRKRATGRVDELLAQQHKTQIVADELDQATLEQVSDVLAASGKSVLEVSAPRDKLESVFLRIVEEAQTRRLATGGSVGTGEVADFLRGGPADGDEVLAELVSAGAAEAAPPASDAAPAPAPGPDDEARGEVLDELVDATPAAEPQPSQASQPARPDEVEPDQSVLDALLGTEPNDEKES